MKYYIIKIPEVSAGLRRTYHKNLEVFECTQDISQTNQMYASYDVVLTHKYSTKKGWYTSDKKERRLSGKVSPTTELVKKPNWGEKTIVFTDLDLAKASKVFLINDMKTTYLKEIANLEESLKRNVPDVDGLVTQYKMMYAEEFI